MSAANSSVSERSKVLQIRMHDLPISDLEIEKVVISIDRIEVHHTQKGWITVSSEPRLYDLLELQNGISVVIFEEPLEIGKYTQIRLVLNENNEVFVNGRPYRLKVPSGEQTGVKLITPFEIEEGKMVEVVLDFDAMSSVKYASGQGFRLNPVIKVENIAEYDGLGIVNTQGGNATNLEGDFNLIIPAGALDKSIIVSMEEVDPATLPGTIGSERTLVSKVYNLEPDGYSFAKDVTLQVSFAEEAISGLGSKENLVILNYNYELEIWEEVPSTVVASANIIHAQLSHFSTYVAAMVRTCADGIQNGDETGIDCGWSCPAECVDCNDSLVLEGNAPTGSGPMAEVYSFGDEAARDAARLALEEYAASRGDLVGGLTWVELLNRYSPDEKMEAVSRYVHRHMAYMDDEDDIEWKDGLQQILIPNSAFSISIPTPPGYPDPPDIPTPPGLPGLPEIDDFNPFDPLAVLPSHLIQLEDGVQNSIEILLEELIENPIPRFDEFLLGKYNDYICDLIGENQFHLDQDDWDPLFGYYLKEIYERIYSLYPDAMPQTAAYTVQGSKNRQGKGKDENGVAVVKDCKELATNADIAAREKLDDASYCGDCEDFAVLRASLLRHLGVASQCVMNMDHHTSFWSAAGASNGSVPISINGPIGSPGDYDYETATNLFQNGGEDDEGHTFNVVIYQNKYRIMDYDELSRDHYAFIGSDPHKEMHRGDHVWNDQFGRQWFPELSRVDTPPNTLCIDPLDPDIGELAGAFGLSLDYISPGEKTRNYPGPVACYEPGYDSWTHKTLYSDICP
jgi:hypothetical protein